MIQDNFLPYEESRELKNLGFDEKELILKFYTKPNSKMISIDEHGRYYPIKNTSKKLYNIGEYFALKEENIIIAPLYQQVFSFFRKEYDLHGIVDLQACNPSHWYFRIDKISINNYLFHSEDEGLKFETYEEAELACIRKIIEICKIYIN